MQRDGTISKNEVPVEQTTNWIFSCHSPRFKWNCLQLSSAEGKAWKSSPSLFSGLCLLSTMQSVELYCGGQRGVTTSNPITSSASSITSAPLKAHLWKNTIKRVCQVLPLGELCVMALRRKKFTLSYKKVTDVLYTWRYVPDWMQRKIDPDCPASRRWWWRWS